MTFWTNGLDFANLTAKGSPLGADSMLLADSASSPAGQPKQALMSNFPVASTLSGFVANQPVVSGANSASPLTNLAAGTIGETLISLGASGSVFMGYPAALASVASTLSYAATGIGNRGPSAATTTTTLTAGTIYYFYFNCAKTFLFTGISIYVVTGIVASSIAFSLYNSAGYAPTGSPLANSSSGSLASTVSGGAITYTFSSPIQLNGGIVYMVALTVSSSLIAFKAAPANSDFSNGAPGFNPISATNDHITWLEQTTAGYNPVFPAASITGPHWAAERAMPLLYLIA